MRPVVFIKIFLRFFDDFFTVKLSAKLNVKRNLRPRPVKRDEFYFISQFNTVFSSFLCVIIFRYFNA